MSRFLSTFFHKNQGALLAIGGSKDASLPPPPPNSFIYMQFSAKSLQNNPNLGIDGSRKVLEPPLLAELGIILGPSQIRKIGINAYFVYPIH